MRRTAAASIAVVGLAAAIALILLGMPRWLEVDDRTEVPQSLAVERVVFRPGSIELTIRNGGQAPVRVSQVAVNEAYWQFSTDKSELGRLETSKLQIDYPWIRGEPLVLKIVSADGQTFTHPIDFPVETQTGKVATLKRYLPLGLFVGVIPVSAGMLVRPFLRRSKEAVWEFFLAFTVGVLVAIGVDAVGDILELTDELAAPLSGRLLAVTVATLSFAAIYEASRRIRRKNTIATGVVTAWALAVAIGLHNLGEGLAIAGAEAAGALAAGALLALGFAIHNVSEGVAIAASLGRRSASARLYAGTIAVAGLPALLGLMIGSFSPLQPVSVILLAVGLGAIAEVIVEVWALIQPPEDRSAPRTQVMAGVVSGLGFMYVTSLLL